MMKITPHSLIVNDDTKIIPQVSVDGVCIRFLKNAGRIIQDPVAFYQTKGKWYCCTDSEGWKCKVTVTGALEIVNRKLSRMILAAYNKKEKTRFKLIETEDKGLFILSPITTKTETEKL